MLLLLDGGDMDIFHLELKLDYIKTSLPFISYVNKFELMENDWPKATQSFFS